MPDSLEGAVLASGSRGKLAVMINAAVPGSLEVTVLANSGLRTEIRSCGQTV